MRAPNTNNNTVYSKMHFCVWRTLSISKKIPKTSINKSAYSQKLESRMVVKMISNHILIWTISIVGPEQETVLNYTTVCIGWFLYA